MSALLEVNNLEVSYAGNRGGTAFKAVDNVSLTVRKGEVVGLVGESGSGKSSIGRAIVGLAPISAGAVLLNGEAIRIQRKVDRRSLARDVQVIFQDPFSSLNPTMTIEKILTEPLRAAGFSYLDSTRKVRKMLDSVGLPADSLDRHPREFSGGQRQRIAIARALTVEPKLIICDEPVSALDLTTQAVVLELMLDIQKQTGISYLFISHDLAVVKHVSHRIAVMKSGQIVEFGTNEEVNNRPVHEYTKKLLLAAPVADPVRQLERRNQRLAAKLASPVL